MQVSPVNFPDYFKSELMETVASDFPPLFTVPLSRLLQIGINGNRWGLPRRFHLCSLSRLLQIGINGNSRNPKSKKRTNTFPDYFKSELMETKTPKPKPKPIIAFPDYFKSELMETQPWRSFKGDDLDFPDYFKSELMETIVAVL